MSDRPAIPDDSTNEWAKLSRQLCELRDALICLSVSVKDHIANEDWHSKSEGYVTMAEALFANNSKFISPIEKNSEPQ